MHMTTAQLMDAVIEKQAANIKWWMDEAGMDLDTAAAHVKANSTLGHGSWARVMDRVRGEA